VVRIGLIGAGKWGQNIIRSINRLPGLEVSYVCTKYKKPSIEFLINFQYTQNWKDLIASDKVDAVIISTPAETHYEMLMHVINQKKPVFVEKPHCLSSNEADNLLKNAEEKKSIVIIDHIYLFHEYFKTLKNKLTSENKKIFKINAIGGNYGPFRKDTTVLWDYGPHDIAMIIDLLTEEPSKIQVIYQGNKTKVDAEKATVDIQLSFKTGVVANIQLSNQFTKRVRLFEIVTDKDKYVFDDTNVKNNFLMSPLENALNKFKEKILNQEQYIDDLILGLKVIKIIEECQIQIDAQYIS